MPEQELGKGSAVSMHIKTEAKILECGDDEGSRDKKRKTDF